MPEEIITQKTTTTSGNKKGLVLVGMVVVVAIVFGFGGYYLGKNKSVSEPATPAAETAVIEQSVTTTSSPTASTTADDTANWKTYTNDTYGFSFRYPADATIVDGSVSKCVEFSKVITKSNGERIMFDYSESIATASCSNNTYTSLAEMVAGENTSLTKIADTTLGGQPAIAAKEGAAGGYNYDIFAEKNNHIYNLVFIGPDTNNPSSTYEKTLDSTDYLILSTFQFTK